MHEFHRPVLPVALDEPAVELDVAGLLPRVPAAGGEAQLFVFFIMVVAAAEVSVGLAIIVLLFRNTRSVDVAFLNRLKH